MNKKTVRIIVTFICSVTFFLSFFHADLTRADSFILPNYGNTIPLNQLSTTYNNLTINQKGVADYIVGSTTFVYLNGRNWIAKWSEWSDQNFEDMVDFLCKLGNAVWELTYIPLSGTLDWTEDLINYLSNVLGYSRSYSNDFYGGAFHNQYGTFGVPYNEKVITGYNKLFKSNDYINDFLTDLFPHDSKNPSYVDEGLSYQLFDFAVDYTNSRSFRPNNLLDLQPYQQTNFLQYHNARDDSFLYFNSSPYIYDDDDGYGNVSYFFAPSLIGDTQYGTYDIALVYNPDNGYACLTNIGSYGMVANDAILDYLVKVDWYEITDQDTYLCAFTDIGQFFWSYLTKFSNTGQFISSNLMYECQSLYIADDSLNPFGNMLRFKIFDAPYSNLGWAVKHVFDNKFSFKLNRRNMSPYYIQGYLRNVPVYILDYEDDLHYELIPYDDFDFSPVSFDGSGDPGYSIVPPDPEGDGDPGYIDIIQIPYIITPPEEPDPDDPEPEDPAPNQPVVSGPSVVVDNYYTYEGDQYTYNEFNYTYNYYYYPSNDTFTKPSLDVISNFLNQDFDFYVDGDNPFDSSYQYDNKNPFQYMSYMWAKTKNGFDFLSGCLHSFDESGVSAIFAGGLVSLAIAGFFSKLLG